MPDQQRQPHESSISTTRHGGCQGEKANGLAIRPEGAYALLGRISHHSKSATNGGSAVPTPAHGCSVYRHEGVANVHPDAIIGASAMMTGRVALTTEAVSLDLSFAIGRGLRPVRSWVGRNEGLACQPAWAKQYIA